MKRILHVLRQMNPGGIECWLDRLIRNWPRSTRPDFHLVLETEDFGSLAPSLATLGVHFHHCPPPSQLPAMWSGFRKLLANLHPVSAVHCHNHRASGFHLAAAASHGVPLRIAHSHADFRLRDHALSPARRLYAALSKHTLAAVANTRLAVSRSAALDLFGPQAAQASIVPCGTDFEPLLRATPTRDPSRFNLIHVGRLVPEKNQAFLLHLLKALVRVEPRASLQLIGDGPLKPSLLELAASLSLAGHVEFLGNRDDIPQRLAAADVFVFPSLSEGLGLAAIEAQLAGLPVLIASHLPAELDVIPALCRRLALDLPVQAWVNSLLEMRHLESVPPNLRRLRVADSPLSIQANIRSLEQIYASS